MTINFENPQYQRALLRSLSKDRRAIKSTANLTRLFANQELGRQLAFNRIALSKKMFDDDLAFKRNRMKIMHRMFEKRLSEKQKENMFDALFGIGTGLYSAFEGRRRAKRRAALLAEEREVREEFKKFLINRNRFMPVRSKRGRI